MLISELRMMHTHYIRVDFFTGCIFIQIYVTIDQKQGYLSLFKN